MVAHSRAPLRPDRLRALNLPVRVTVVTGEDGMPVEMRETGSGNAAALPTPPRHSGSGGTFTAAPPPHPRHSGTAAGADNSIPPSRHPTMPLSRAMPPSNHAAKPPPPRRIESVVETWRIDDEWWRVPIARQCYDVVLEGGGHMVLFQNLLTGEWFAQRP